MKALLFGLSFFLFFGLYAQPESGAFNYGKYDFGLTIELTGKSDLRFGAKLGYRSFRGPFGRPVNYSANLMTGPSTFKGDIDIGADIGAYQVYANGNDFNAGFGLGAGLHAYYECEGMKDEKIRLQGMVNPGYYAGNYSLSLSTRFDLLKVDLNAGAAKDNLQFFATKSIGFMGDYQSPLIAGAVGYGYYTLPEEKEAPQEEDAGDEDEGIRFQPGLHLHLSF